MSRLKKVFYRLYYRRYVAKTIADLVCVNANDEITKVGATFATEGAADQLFGGMTVVIDAVTYRVLEGGLNDTAFTIDRVFESVNNTYSGVFTTPALLDMLGSALIMELDAYWTELAKVEVGAFIKIEKGDNVQLSTGSVEVISENASIEFNVLGFQERETTPYIEGRWTQLRTAINGKLVDILFFNDDVNEPDCKVYYNIIGNVALDIMAADLAKIVITPSKTESAFDENDLDIMLFTIETPIAIPGAQAGPVDVVVTCVTRDVSMYYTTNGDVPDSGDTLIANGGTILALDDCTLKVKAFKNGMADSAVLEEIYT